MFFVVNTVLPLSFQNNVLCFSDGAGELLDAWLMLVEKLTNRRTLLDSPHVLPSQSTAPRFVPFDPQTFISSTQKVC